MRRQTPGKKYTENSLNTSSEGLKYGRQNIMGSL